jgi:hypothetical protein
MKIIFFPFFTIKLLLLLCLLSGCRSDAHQLASVPTVMVNPSFQRQLSPAPTVPLYRCGAWTSNNTPDGYATLTIYAKLTKEDMAGVRGIPATASVHFQHTNVMLDQRPVSNQNGYVTFTLPLQGRQPRLIPATVDVKFAVSGSPVQCEAFFTPQ